MFLWLYVTKRSSFDKMSEVQPYQFEPICNPRETIENKRSDEESPLMNTRLLDAAVSACFCGKCTSMDSEEECLCCAEIATIYEFVLNSDSSCIMEMEEFKTVYLDPLVLKLAITAMLETGSHPGGAPIEPIPNRSVKQVVI